MKAAGQVIVRGWRGDVNSIGLRVKIGLKEKFEWAFVRRRLV